MKLAASTGRLPLIAVVAFMVVLMSVSLATATAAATSTAVATSRITLARALTGYSRPVLVTHAGGGSRVIFIVEQTGKIKRATFQNGRWRKLGVFLDLSARVSDPRRAGNGERGLLGLAFHPNYARNGRFYVNYTRRGAGARNGDTVVAEYRRQTASRARPSSGRLVMTINQPFSNHNGGHLAFGPDGLLYIGVGDGGSGGDPRGNAQKLTTRLGKLLRIDPIDPDGKGPRTHRVPASNPRAGRYGRNEIWAWGLRNPWRFSFDRANGDLWIGDVGQGRREEIDRSRAATNGRNAGKGANYGWRRCEGSRRYPDTSRTCMFGVRPVHDYAHGTGRCSVTGGYVHRGPASPGWRGLYVAGDFCGRLFVLDGSGRVRLSKTMTRSLSSFGEDAAGRLFATSLGGTIYLVKLSGPRP